MREQARHAAEAARYRGLPTRSSCADTAGGREVEEAAALAHGAAASAWMHAQQLYLSERTRNAAVKKAVQLSARAAEADADYARCRQQIEALKARIASRRNPARGPLEVDFLRRLPALVIVGVSGKRARELQDDVRAILGGALPRLRVVVSGADGYSGAEIARAIQQRAARRNPPKARARRRNPLKFRPGEDEFIHAAARVVTEARLSHRGKRVFAVADYGPGEALIFTTDRTAARLHAPQSGEPTIGSMRVWAGGKFDLKVPTEELFDAIVDALAAAGAFS